MRKVLISSALLLVVFLLAGCQGQDLSTTIVPKQPPKQKVTDKNADVLKGLNQNMQAIDKDLNNLDTQDGTDEE